MVLPSIYEASAVRLGTGMAEILGCEEGTRWRGPYWQGLRVARFVSEVDPGDADDMRGLFIGAMARDRASRGRRPEEYEMRVRRRDLARAVITYAGRCR